MTSIILCLLQEGEVTPLPSLLPIPMAGSLCRGSYKSVNGKKRHGSWVNVESLHARGNVPCACFLPQCLVGKESSQFSMGI